MCNGCCCCCWCSGEPPNAPYPTGMPYPTCCGARSPYIAPRYGCCCGCCCCDCCCTMPMGRPLSGSRKLIPKGDAATCDARNGGCWPGPEAAPGPCVYG